MADEPVSAQCAVVASTLVLQLECLASFFEIVPPGCASLRGSATSRFLAKNRGYGPERGSVLMPDQTDMSSSFWMRKAASAWVSWI